MIRQSFIFLLLVFSTPFLDAQKFTHIVKVHYAAFTNKRISMLGYDLGIRKMCFSISGGIGNGKDNQFLSADKIGDQKSIQKVRASQTIYPEIYPAQTYLESCNSTYEIQQLRLGFAIFIRNDDTLGRYHCTGPHVGVEALFTNTRESQIVVYKSELNDTRFSFSGTNHFHEIGAGTHVGWQFAFFKAHLFVDLRAVISFYWPLMPEPNLNSPYAGNRWELQAGIGWHFYKNHETKVKSSDKDQIREKI